MKKVLFLTTILFSILTMGQYTADKNIDVQMPKEDDLYLAGETVTVDAIVNGDVVAAGGKIIIQDSIRQDLIVAGGEIVVKGYVADDIRAAGGRLTIDGEVGDDVIIAGGEVVITENAVIHGNLVNFSGNIEMKGEVLGTLKSHSGNFVLKGRVGQEANIFGEDILIDGEILGISKIAAESVNIGSNAKFFNNVEYWSRDGIVEFNNSLIQAKAVYNDELMEGLDNFSWKGTGFLVAIFFIIYVLSAFVILLLLNWAFGKLFLKASQHFRKDLLKGTGYGLIYLFGMPLIILFTFLLIIGIPISLFLLSVYGFSILFGHLVASLLITHYLDKNRQWKFWQIVFISLGIGILLRLITLIPFLGTLVSILVIALSYGVLLLVFIQQRKNKLKAV
ncbi:hypothetical protein MWU78_07030 [Arenibacter sp. F26102]|uniref:hypothetical protein n=1 Tax=Arenibacter sp. F26102 TaxID=2926416 RepID=UPI001FF254AB|nr:hypothetical protein [Arenibacter sp. F26102]MCK0145388.1 hypothetical protein [Arenibacter sp. F26102]